MKEYSQIKSFNGKYRGVEPDGEHWLGSDAIYRLMLGEAIHMVVILENGERKIITVKHGPGKKEEYLYKIEKLLWESN